MSMTNAHSHLHYGIKKAGARVQNRLSSLLIREDPTRDRRLYPRLTEPDYLILVCLRKAIRRAAASCNGVLVDYGCGSKPYRELFNSVKEYIGVDFEVTDPTDRQLSSDGSLPLENESADVVLSTQVLEHIADVRKYLNECARALRPGGRLILTTHGIWPYHPQTHCDDFYRWTPAGLRREIELCGLRAVNITTACSGILCLAQQMLVLNRPSREHGLLGTLARATLNLFVNSTMAILSKLAPRLMTNGDIIPICLVIEAVKAS